MRLSAAPLRCQMRWVILDLGELPCRQQIEFRAPGRVASAEAVIFLRRAQLKAALGACLVELAHRRVGRASYSQFPNSLISGDAAPTGMGGRGVSPVGAGGSGRSRSGIRLRGENTPVSWSAVGGGWGALISSGGSALGGSGSAAVTGPRLDVLSQTASLL